jgi:hypothetical protein
MFKLIRVALIGVIAFSGLLLASALVLWLSSSPSSAQAASLSSPIAVISANSVESPITSTSSFTVYLPIVSKPPSIIGGRVTLNGTPAAGVSLELRFYNGSSFSTLAITTTAADGSYVFANAPSLAAGQKYYVRFLNPATTADGRLADWFTRDLTSYTAGNSVEIGNFDLADITLQSPAPDAIVSLPNAFQWTVRPATPSDSYEFNLSDPVDSSPFFYTIPPLGYVSSYTLNSLPGGFSVGTSYGWFVAVYSPDGGYGESFYYRGVKFSNTGMSVTTPSQSLQLKTVRDVEDRHER